MPPIQLTLFQHKTLEGLAYQHIRIDITSPDKIIEPQDIKGVVQPQGIRYDQGIVLEGRAPIWLYTYLVHEYHCATWVGCYDPRLGGAVLTQSHVHGAAIGQVLKLNLP